MQPFLELRRRGVLKVATGYLVVSWLTLEVGHTLFNVFELPHAALQFVFVIIALGFPLALLGAWQGWFGAVRMDDPHATPGAASAGHPATGHHEGPWLAAVFGAVAVFAVAVAIGVRFFGMGHSASRESSQAAPAANLPLASAQVATGIAALPPVAVSNKSIAVLPFVNMSEDRSNEYFSDGLSEELIDLLTKIPGLRVPARTSSFYFKGRQSTIADIARALGVAHVLEGSVRKSGNTLRITAQLIRADSGYHVWSRTYDRPLDDVFKVQDDIAGAVVGALKVSLLGAEAPRATPTANTEAYTQYLQAKSIYQRGTQADFDSAAAYLQKTLQLDPDFAPAWATLANVHADTFATFHSRPYAQVSVDAHTAVDKALQLDPRLSAAHQARGRIAYQVDWDWDRAESELGTAIELDPGNAIAMRIGAYVAIARGQSDAAVQLAQRAIARDPLDYWNYFALGAAHYSKGQMDAAEADYRKALELNATADGLHYFLALTYLAQGEPDAALAESKRESVDAYRQILQALALDQLGRRREADRFLGVAEQKYAQRYGYQIGLVHASRHELDQAFAWIDRAYGQHYLGPLFMRNDPLQKNLQGDPRFTAFLQKMKLLQ
jgi:TolB-like protein/Tfp pilus assembly protein PilF